MINEFQRIQNMHKKEEYCKCPSCQLIVHPRTTGSGLYWCPRCLNGKAAMFWTSYGNEHELAMERLKQIKENNNV